MKEVSLKITSDGVIAGTVSPEAVSAALRAIVLNEVRRVTKFIDIDQIVFTLPTDTNPLEFTGTCKPITATR